MKEETFHIEGLHRNCKEISRIITQCTYKGHFIWYGRKAELVDVWNDGIKVVIKAKFI